MIRFEYCPILGLKYWVMKKPYDKRTSKKRNNVKEKHRP